MAEVQSLLDCSFYFLWLLALTIEGQFSPLLNIFVGVLFFSRVAEWAGGAFYAVIPQNDGLLRCGEFPTMS